MILVNSHLETKSPDGGNMILYSRATYSETQYLFMMENKTLSVILDHDLLHMSILPFNNRLKTKFMWGYQETQIKNTKLLDLFRNDGTVIAEIIRRLEE